MKIDTLLFNSRQQLRSLLCQPPLLCHHVAGRRSFCKRGCAPGDVFRCPTCDRLMPYCLGAGDEYEDICDNCWAIANQMEEAIEPFSLEEEA